MNKALATLFVTLLFATQPALADDAHHPDQAGQAPAATPAGAAQGISEPEMQALTKQMSKTQALMRQIKRTKNPVERGKLLHEHMAMMQQGMMMMQRMGGGNMMGGMGMMGAGPQAGGPMSPEMMQQRLELMQNRMDMMQMMMGQMLEQQQAEQMEKK